MNKEMIPFELGVLGADETERLRFLRSNFLYSTAKDVKTVLVATDKDASSAAAAILKFACALTAAGKTVLVIDSDRANACVASLVKCDCKQTLNSYLKDQTAIGALAQKTKIENLEIVCCQTPREEGLGDDRKMKQLVEEMRTKYDYVFLIAAPAAEGADVYSYDEIVDASMIVAREKSTSHKFLKIILEYYARRERKVAGIVLI